MGVTIAVTRVACNTTTGTQDITSADLGGLTPKAVWFIVTQATADGTATDHAVLGIGAATGASNRWSCGVFSEHGLATTDTGRRIVSDECVVKLNTGDANIDGEADFDSFISNGVRIDWTNAPASAHLLTVILFAGTDLSAQAGTFTMPDSVDGTVDVNTVGFEPDVVLSATTGLSAFDASDDTWMIGHGVALNTSPVQQYAVGFWSQDAWASGYTSGHITDDYGVVSVDWDGTLTGWGGEFGSFDADGFSVTQRLGAGANYVGFLALAFASAVGFSAGIIDSPTSTGNQSITDPGFTPQAVYVGLTQMQAINTAYSGSDQAGAKGIAVFDDDDEYCNSIADENGSATSDTQSLSDDTAINFPQDDGLSGFVASFVSFDANGWTWNFSAVMGTATKWWYLAIEEEAAAGGGLTERGIARGVLRGIGRGV